MPTWKERFAPPAAGGYAPRARHRIPEDIAWILDASSMGDQENAHEVGALWDGDGEQLQGGHNYAEEADE